MPAPYRKRSEPADTIPDAPHATRALHAIHDADLPSLQQHPWTKRRVVWHILLALLLCTTVAAHQKWARCWPLSAAGPEDSRAYAGAGCTDEWGTLNAFSTFNGMLGQYGITLPSQAQNVRFLFEDHSGFNAGDYQLYLKFSSPEPALSTYLSTLKAVSTAPNAASLEQILTPQDSPALGTSWSFAFGLAPFPAHAQTYTWSRTASKGTDVNGEVVAIPNGNHLDIYTVATDNE